MDFDNIASTELNILSSIADITGVPDGAYNIRINGQAAGRAVTDSIDIVTKTDKPGIDIIVSPATVGETVYIPVVVSADGLKDYVYNDFYIGEAADVTIIAGCGIHNEACDESRHDGIHTFHVAKNARVRYVEKHYGEGNGEGVNIMNPTTVINIAENGYMEMETVQIRGIDSTERVTQAALEKGSTLIVREKIMTHGKQRAITSFTVDLNGEKSSTHLISRSVARDSSYQEFNADMRGHAVCHAHSECDAIIMDNAAVTAVPQIKAYSSDAVMVHEAAIGKLQGEQLDKLMTLGLSAKEAEDKIIQGFLK